MEGEKELFGCFVSGEKFHLGEILNYRGVGGERVKFLRMEKRPVSTPFGSGDRPGMDWCVFECLDRSSDDIPWVE
jgi:hypothetical protein